MDKRIYEIIASVLDTDLDLIDDNTLLSEELGADSIDLIEIISQAELEFGINIPDDLLPDIKSVADLTSLVIRE